MTLIKPNLYCSDPRFLYVERYVESFGYALPRFADNSYITFFVTTLGAVWLVFSTTQAHLLEGQTSCLSIIG